MKVVVGLSGGVDSAVAAALLKYKGFEVVGVTLRFNNCCDDGIEQAKSVSKHLNITHHIVDVRDRFENKVLKNSWLFYDQNKTPNPCALCNRFVKFPCLFEYADRFGDFVATGHYATIENGKLYRGTSEKDQSYFLYSLTDLNRIMFPLGNMTKDFVRAYAKKIGLPNAGRKESQDLCFASENFQEDLRKMFNGRDCSGKLVHGDRIIGNHTGTYNFTIGQRSGAHGYYVVGFNGNDVMVDDYQRGTYNMIVSDLNWISKPMSKVLVQTRYRQKPSGATLWWNDETVAVKFAFEQHSITPGQIAVFYNGNEVLGGGIISLETI